MKTTHSLVTIALAACAASCSSSDSNPGYTPFANTGGSAGAGNPVSDASTSTDASAGAAGASASKGCPFSNFTILQDGGCACAPGSDKICDGPARDGGIIPTCIDSMADPNNCGACGTKCDPTVACVSGKCGKAPAALVAAASGCTSIHLTFDGGKIYWTDQGHGTVKSIAPMGGAATAIATGEMAPTLIIVRDGNVYWVDSGNNSIRGVTAANATPTTLVAMAPPSPDGGVGAENEGIHGITLSPDGGTLYFSAGTDVYKVPKAGGTVVEVGYSEGPRHGVPGALAVDTKYAYYPTGVNGNVEVMPLTMMCDPAAATAEEPTCPFRQARSQTPLVLDTIFLRGDKLYWAQAQAVRVGSVSAKLDAGLAGMDGSDYSSTFNAGNVTGFALGTANAYFGEFPPAQGKPEVGFIERAGNPPYAAGMTPSAVVIARSQPNPTSFAVDGTNVFWTTTNCDIQMIADTPQ